MMEDSLAFDEYSNCDLNDNDNGKATSLPPLLMMSNETDESLCCESSKKLPDMKQEITLEI